MKKSLGRVANFLPSDPRHSEMLPTSLVNDLNLISIFLELRNNAYDHEIRKLKPNPDLHTASLFSFLNPAYKSKLLDLIDHSPHHLPPLIYSQLKRSLGSLCGLAIADSLGHNFEFLPVQDEFLNSYFEYPSSKPGGKIHDPLNQFRLKPGQWTDDASMSLCQADSLLACGGFNGSHTRCYYWNWWNNNVDNAFRYDDSRTNSCGLGGNISQSLGDISHRIEAGTGDFVIPHRYGSFTEDSGNGSLMRLAPIPIRYHQSLQHARQVASLSSLTTHPGSIAAEACAFVSYLVVKCIHLPTPLPSVSQHSPQASSLKSSFLASFHSSSGSSSSSPPSSASSSLPCLSSESNIQDFLTEVINEYIELRDGEERGADGELKSTAEGGGSVGWISLRRLLIGRDNPPTERCWNWREESLNFKSTLEARGRR
jgi:ADP-ribosylglycohydrolase